MVEGCSSQGGDTGKRFKQWRKVSLPLYCCLQEILVGLHLHQLTYAFVVTYVLVSCMRETRRKCNGCMLLKDRTRCMRFGSISSVNVP